MLSVDSEFTCTKNDENTTTYLHCDIFAVRTRGAFARVIIIIRLFCRLMIYSYGTVVLLGAGRFLGFLSLKSVLFIITANAPALAEVIDDSSGPVDIRNIFQYEGVKIGPRYLNSLQYPKNS